MKRVLASVGTGLAVLALAACGSSEPTGSPSATSSSPSGSASASSAADGSLVGTWQANAQDILNSNTANLGSGAGLTCTGPIRMTFTDAGAFSRAGSVRCTAGSQSRRGTVASAGRYSTSGDQLTISGFRSTGSTPDSFGNASATYAVSGSTLSITFTQASVGTVTQTYQRAG